MINVAVNNILAILCGAASLAALLLLGGLLQDRRTTRDALLIIITGSLGCDMLFGAVTFGGFRSYLPVALSGPPHLYLLLVPLMYSYVLRKSAVVTQPTRAWIHALPFFTFHLLRLPEVATRDILPWLTIHEAKEYAALAVVVGYAMHLIYVVRAGGIVSASATSLFGSSSILKGSLYILLGCYVGRVLTNVLIGVAPVVVVVRFLFVFASISVLVLTLAYWRQRYLDLRAARVPEIECTTQITKEKYGNNRLPEFISRSIVHSLEQHMMNDKPWLKVDLTLAQLAQGINVNSHHLSQIINLQFGKSFACFINEYRVNEACKLLSGSKSKAVLEVALESGFASKSSFNTLFKKQTGLTPSEYRKKYFASSRVAA